MERMNLSHKLRGLVIFRNLLNENLIKKLILLLDCDLSDTKIAVELYADFANSLLNKSNALGCWLSEYISCDENILVKRIAKKQDTQFLLSSLDYELSVIQEIADIDFSEIISHMGFPGILPVIPLVKTDIRRIYTQMLDNIFTNGYGIFAKHNAFTLSDQCELIPITNPDAQRLSDLYGYENERKKIIANTQALLSGTPACNVLLYGDAGTGKSSTVKAIINEYCDKGLRLVEVPKHQFSKIPRLLSKLADNPLKFIIFIDDLCFHSDDKDFSEFKAILEGSVNSRSRNVVIYATSNHRHMVKERVADRLGEEINVADTLQEISSLAARFGLTVTFLKPDKQLYSHIVCSLADLYGIDAPKEQLVAEAEIYAMRAGGRTARVAKQFIELHSSQII